MYLLLKMKKLSSFENSIVNNFKKGLDHAQVIERWLDSHEQTARREALQRRHQGLWPNLNEPQRQQEARVEVYRVVF
jgi:hypothetical protein